MGFNLAFKGLIRSFLSLFVCVLQIQRGSYRVLEGKTKGMRALGRPRSRREDNIKLDLQEVGWGHGLVRCDSG